MATETDRFLCYAGATDHGLKAVCSVVLVRLVLSEIGDRRKVECLSPVIIWLCERGCTAKSNLILFVRVALKQSFHGCLTKRGADGVSIGALVLLPVETGGEKIFPVSHKVLS